MKKLTAVNVCTSKGNCVRFLMLETVNVIRNGVEDIKTMIDTANLNAMTRAAGAKGRGETYRIG